MNWKDTFIDNCCYRLDESQRMIHQALADLKEAQLAVRPNEVSNALGNQLLHLCGNIRQYLIATLGAQADQRDRDAEFSPQAAFSKKNLLKQLDQTIAEAQAVLRSRTDADFLTTYKVQAYTLSGVGVALHAVEHCSYHTGQIAFWVKQLVEKDLGFYAQVDLNQKHHR
jgi:uncharacterized damage-inducible protein DinB